MKDCHYSASGVVDWVITTLFFEAKMALGVETSEVGWDLSLRAQSRRALAMNNVWLKEEGDWKTDENKEDGYSIKNLVGNKKSDYGQTFDPILGFNLEGKLTGGQCTCPILPTQTQQITTHYKQTNTH
ncbi:hypothetical protein ES332_A11G121300v1 [Gossypium tomentosum]|uniref:Uncharacterized protein n=1 Tax=Gossypium tomentosum TaxID=34277 RepID=A0A5D2N9Y7_GOSTO|nr:hypothetical protein ES332_A11G121300v1 [Gossypium tomentosum]